MPLVQWFHTRYLMLSLLTSVHLYLLSTWVAFLSFLWLSQRRRELWMIFLVLSITYSFSVSPPSLPLSLSLLLHLCSGFKRLSSSLAPRSNWPLPFICQPFDVVPAWAACYALPLTAHPGVRGGLCFRTPPHLNTPHSTTTSHIPCRSVSDAPLSTGLCPPLPLPCPTAHYYFIVWFCIPFTQAVVEGRPLALLLTHVHGFLPQQGETKQQEGDGQ